MDGGAVGHGETLTGVKPPSEAKVADGAGWRAKANELPSRRRPGGSVDPHAPAAMEAIDTFSLLRRKPQRWVFIRLFETPIPAKASCLGAAIFKPGHHISL
ncbi:hypothetical protein LRM36_04980 [Stenotrophomonas maltophilia]|nr:hypothetical protein [Stenotrophomonas maltophilia]